MAILGSDPGAVLTSRNPARPEEVVAEVPATEPERIAALADRLRGQPLPGPGERAARLAALADGLEARAGELAGLLVAEVGKMPDEARAEVGFAAGIARWYAGLVEPAATGPVRRRPVGLGAAVTPFNFALSLPVLKLAAAHGAGAPALWKPSPHACGVAEALQPVLDASLGPHAGLVQGAGADVLRGVARAGDALSFTGGQGGAEIIWAAVGDRPIPLQLELGSCNATIVAPSFSTADAVPLLAAAAYSYAGQKCSSTVRVLVPRPRAAEVFDALAEVVRAEVVGDPADPATTCPPVISPEAAARVEGVVAGWRAAGASVVAAAPGRGSPCLVAPAVARAEGDGDVFRAEAFGPVAVVVPYDDGAEAVRLSGATPYGLFVGLLTREQADVDRLLAAGVAGIVKVNQTTTGLVPQLPSQGWGASGLGPSELGPDPFAIYQRVQTVYPYELER